MVAIPFFVNILLNREEKCDVKLPWQPNFWMTTIGPRLSNDYGDSNEKERKNPIRLVNKTPTLHVHHA